VRTRWKWTLAIAAAGVIAGIAVRTLGNRQEASAGMAAQQAAGKAQALLEVGELDLLVARTRVLQQGLTISGQLQAVNSAVVKARASGELLDLRVREGDEVKAGQVLARIDPSEYQARLRQSQQQAESARGQFDIAQRSFDNNRALVDQGFISRTALDSSIATLASAQANHRSALAGVDLAEKALADTVLRAPIAGQIAQRLVQNGERVAVDARVVEIVDLRRLELEAALSATDSLQVAVGQRAHLRVEGAPAELDAKVVRISPVATAGSRAVLAYLALDASVGLRQGLYAQGQLATGTVSALALPLSAVRTDKPQPYVQLLSGTQVVHQTVALGARGQADGETLVAVSGIAGGSTLLSGAVGPVREGTQLRRLSATK
jgi:RND family efflux transporter MFP subunit